jgi:fatty-acyl-CoA synthase
MFVPLTPLDFHRRCRRLFADRIAVVDGATRLTFAQLAERIERLAGALQGLRPREPVSWLGPNTHHLLEAFHGVPLAGGVIHPVNPRLPPLEIAQRLNDVGARLVFVHASAVAQAREVVGNLKAVEDFVLVEADAGALGFPAREYEGLLERARPLAPDLSTLDENAPIALFHTSGGVARPRVAVLSHRTLALHALYAALAMGLRDDDASLCSVPFAYMNGGGNPQANLAVGARAVLARHNDPQTVAALIRAERPTVWITAPTVLARFLRSPGLGSGDCASLRLVLVGGAPVPEGMLREARRRLGATCLEVYGLTETSPFVLCDGRPILGVETRVVDEAGAEVPWNGARAGELVVRGNGVMTAYHRDPAATEEALREGWLHTGDLASVDAGGRMRIVGRLRDVVLVDGRRVATAEIESALLEHPDVRECSVIAAPDPDRGEVPVALVVLREGARLTEAALVEHARTLLDAAQVPARVEFLPSLPRSEGGEVLKAELRTLYA